MVLGAQVPLRRAVADGALPGHRLQRVAGAEHQLALRRAVELRGVLVDPAVDADLVARLHDRAAARRGRSARRRRGRRTSPARHGGRASSRMRGTPAPPPVFAPGQAARWRRGPRPSRRSRGRSRRTAPPRSARRQARPPAPAAAPPARGRRRGATPPPASPTGGPGSRAQHLVHRAAKRVGHDVHLCPA